MSQNKVDCGRRRLLAATAALSGAGGLAAIYPLVVSMMPADGAYFAEEPLEVDISNLMAGAMMTVNWSGKPLWIIRRTPAMLESLPGLSEALLDPQSQQPQQPSNCANPYRSIRPDILVVIGTCTHLGCLPIAKFRPGDAENMPADWQGGFLCPCHGATFDLAGRVFKNTLAKSNLLVPPHFFLSENRLLIGADKKVA